MHDQIGRFWWSVVIFKLFLCFWHIPSNVHTRHISLSGLHVYDSHKMSCLAFTMQRLCSGKLFLVYFCVPHGSSMSIVVLLLTTPFMFSVKLSICHHWSHVAKGVDTERREVMRSELKAMQKHKPGLLYVYVVFEHVFKFSKSPWIALLDILTLQQCSLWRKVNHVAKNKKRKLFRCETKSGWSVESWLCYKIDIFQTTDNNIPSNKFHPINTFIHLTHSTWDKVYQQEIGVEIIVNISLLFYVWANIEKYMFPALLGQYGL